MFKKSILVAALMLGVALPANAQDIATRILNIENQIRELTGQIEELNFSVRQLQKQMEKGGQSGSVEAPVAEPPAKKLAAPALAPADTGVEQIGEAQPEQDSSKKLAEISGAQSVTPLEETAPATDGEAAIGEQVAAAPVPGEGVAADGTVQAQGEGIEQVALTPATESPEALYERYYEALLRKRYEEAETGFSDFLQKYPDNSLAGTVQYRLGESFYQRNDFRTAAQHFLKGYTQYPKSRRAPDSLVMLGMSLRKLDQKQKACDAFASVSNEFPRAVEAKKRASAEYKRAGC